MLNKEQLKQKSQLTKEQKINFKKKMQVLMDMSPEERSQFLKKRQKAEEDE